LPTFRRNVPRELTASKASPPFVNRGLKFQFPQRLKPAFFADLDGTV
jgi:hypothetical protein